MRLNKFEKERENLLTEIQKPVYFPDEFQYNKKQRDIQRCEKCLSGVPDKFCPYYSKCPYVQNSTANTVINRFTDFDEIIFYKDNFFVGSGSEVNHCVDRSRKWLRDEEGYLKPKEGVKLSDLNQTIMDSRSRALDNIYGYILCNDWKYFITVTFAQGKSGKLSDEYVMYQWQKFRQQLQYKFPNIGLILVKEDTPTGRHGLHFHGFICNANVDEYLTPARNNKKIYKGKPNPQYGRSLYTDYGDPIFNFMPTLTNIGYSTVVKIKDKNNLKLVNYLTKYMTKGSSNFDYGENSYFHTNNLNFKGKEVSLFTKKEKQSLVNDIMCQCYKETEKFTIYRKYKIKGEMLS